MQFAIDLAKKDYLFRTSPTRTRQEDKAPQQQPSPNLQVSKLDKGAAFVAGAAIAGIVDSSKQRSNDWITAAFERIPDPPTFEETQAAVSKMLHDTGLSDHGIKALFVDDTAEDAKKVSEFFAKDTRIGFARANSGIADNVFKFYAEANATLITRGKEAAYFLNEKCAIASRKNPHFILQKLGQAKVAQHDVLRHLFTTGKKLPIVAIALGFVSMTHTPDKNKMEIQKNKWEKAKDFLDNNIEGIAFLAYMPNFVGESIATHEAWKMSKKYIPDAKMKSLKKLYIGSLLVSLTAAVATSVGINIGNKVQNNIIRQKNSPQDVYNLLI